MTISRPALLKIGNLGAKRPEDLPPNNVYIGRQNTRRACRLPESKWHNPFVIGRDGDRAAVRDKYRAWIVQRPALMSALHELRGKDLVRWERQNANEARQPRNLSRALLMQGAAWSAPFA